MPSTNDLALTQDGDAVRKLLGLVEVVRREENRLAERAERPDHVPRRTARCRVEAGGRLVEEDEVRVADKRYAEVEPALLTAGESLHPRVSLLLEADELDHLVDVARPVVVTGEHAMRLGDRDRRPELRLLQHHPDPLSEGRAGSSGIETEDVYLAGVAGPVALQDLDRGRLPAPFGPRRPKTSPSAISKLIPRTAS